MIETVPIWTYAEINPTTPEFKVIADGTELSYMPLEAIWPGGRADYSNFLLWPPKQNYTQFRRGDILVPKITPTFEAGRAIVANIPSTLGLSSTEVHIVRPNRSTDPRYLQYCFQSLPFLDEGAHSLRGVGNLRRITPLFLQNHKVLRATVDTQRTIADYLDRETGRIDAMIAKLDDMTETLSIRRASEIETFTTRLPKPFTRMAFCGNVALGKTYQGEKKNDGEILVNYVRAASLQSNGLELDDQRMWMTVDDLDKYDLKRGDVLIVEGGAGFGRSVVLKEDMPGWGFQNHVIRVRPNRNYDGRFLDYCVKGHYSDGLINILAEGATIPGFSSEKTRNLPIADLSLEEQIHIADHLDEATSKIDAMLAKVTELKSLLIERRSALITEVVTGRKAVV